jgi:Tol biopolymer transport system component
MAQEDASAPEGSDASAAKAACDFRPLTSMEGNNEDTDPAVSPDGTQVAFIRSLPDGDSLCLVPMSGGEPNVKVLATFADGAIMSPCWGPDGSFLAFAKVNPDRKTVLFQIKSDGQAAGPWADRKPAPEGRSPALCKDNRLAFIFRNNLVIEINRADQVFVTLEGFQDYPDWSPDGTLVAYHKAPCIAVRNPSDEASKDAIISLTPQAPEQSWCSRPRFSPDGKRVACVGLRAAKYDLWVVGVDGSSPTMLTDDDFMDQSLDWAPNGEIVFSSNRSGKFDLWAAKEQPVTQPAAGATPPPATP